MAYKPKTAPRFTRKAATRPLKTLWAKVASSVLGRTRDSGRAIRAANKAVERRAAKRSK